jgi:hypothetical protein
MAKTKSAKKMSRTAAQMHFKPDYNQFKTNINRFEGKESTTITQLVNKNHKMDDQIESLMKSWIKKRVKSGRNREGRNIHSTGVRFNLTMNDWYGVAGVK